MPRTVVPVLTFLLSDISLAAQLTGPIRFQIPEEYEVVPAVGENEHGQPVSRQPASRHPGDRQDKDGAEQLLDTMPSPSMRITWPTRSAPSHYVF